ncbi:MAG: ABC transporter ATP-binding protein [Pirellulaceae bacterium]|jgi:ABC-type lipoprotein export system ATPase subunit|nr:ABC transporter ATP-binding protein [Pirellulaceae bacterium]
MSSDSIIELHNVSKVYRTRRGEVRALDAVSAVVAAGEYLALRGPSGSGKSTLLALIGGLALPTTGRVRVADTVMSEVTAAERAAVRAHHLGYVFQMFHLLPFLNVLQNVLVAAPQASDPAAREYAAALVEQLGLGARRHHRPGQLSIGERQRVALARALLNRPEILLADEPTGNLDTVNAAIVLDHIDQFHQAGGTVLLVSHEEHALGRAQRVMTLDRGRLNSN